MPVIYRESGFRFFFFSREHRPPHVHVERGEGAAKFLLSPVRLIFNDGLKPRELAQAAEIVHSRAVEFEDAWNGKFGEYGP